MELEELLIDEIMYISGSSLSEAWLSDEDEQWDELYNNNQE